MGSSQETPPAATTKPPKHLRGEAKAEWRRIIAQRGPILQIDQAALAGYCCLWATFVGAQKTIDAEGPIVKLKNGSIIQHPALGVRNTALKHLRSFAHEFGLTPRSRGELTRSTGKPQVDSDTLAGLDDADDDGGPIPFRTGGAA